MGENEGWIYIPNACNNGGCKMHIGLHGCGGRAKGMAGRYNNIGALNNIIMVFPDTKCWNNIGSFDSNNYNKKTGIVPSALKSIIDRVTSTGGGGGGDGDNQEDTACTDYKNKISEA